MNDVVAFGLLVLLQLVEAWYFYRLGFGHGVTTLTRTIDDCLARKRREAAGLEEEP